MLLFIYFLYSTFNTIHLADVCQKCCKAVWLMSSGSGSEYISVIEMRTSQRYEVAYAQRTWTDFCRKELREKVGVEFLSEWVNAHGPTFYRRQNIDFLSELLCVTITGEVSLLMYVTPIFYRTELNARGPIFCRKQLREKIGPSFYRTKSQRTRTDFHSEFLSTIKNRSVCAGHY